MQLEYCIGTLTSTPVFVFYPFVSFRDLKPDNILLNREPRTQQLQVKISDFGLARKLREGEMAQTLCGFVSTPS